MQTNYIARRVRVVGATLAGAAALGPVPAAAHSFGQVYTLPVPFWLYAWAAAATLVVSFVVAGVFLRVPVGAPSAATRGRERELPARLVLGLQLLSVALLVLCIATGFAGTPSPYLNFNMTFFWIVFVLGYAYLTALIGDLYALINPWRALVQGIDRVVPGFARGRIAHPERFGYAPALALFAAFIWFELFGPPRPFALAVALGAYTALNLLGAFAVGAAAWFRYGELFSVMLRLIARVAPVAFAHEDGGAPSRTFRFRRPLAGLLHRAPEAPTLLLFALFMLAATAFDGWHESKPWLKLFWFDLYRDVFAGWMAGQPFRDYPVLARIFPYWQTAWLLLSPLLYLAAYLGAIVAMRRFTGTGLTTRELALRFMHSLLPIVLVYHVTHYYTLIQTQGLQILALASDPFGWGWNLLGTAHAFQGARLPDVRIVWHVQVALILAGHVASVVVAHLEALQIFQNRRTATLSQVPMLALMVAFTVAGLWILSLPFGSLPKS